MLLVSLSSSISILHVYRLYNLDIWFSVSGNSMDRKDKSWFHLWSKTYDEYYPRQTKSFWESIPWVRFWWTLVWIQLGFQSNIFNILEHTSIPVQFHNVYQYLVHYIWYQTKTWSQKYSRPKLISFIVIMPWLGC